MIVQLSNFIWDNILIYTLIPIGLVFTIMLGFVQVRYFGHMFSILGTAFHHEGNQPTSFQALTLSVAGRVGSGNIAGVALAITAGGPGAIFWMWLVGFIGMATSFVECTLAQAYKRVEPSGLYRGGPAVYMDRGLRHRLGGAATALAGVYAVLLLITFGFAFTTLQSFAVSSSIESAFGVPSLYVGIGLAILVGIAVFGGVKRIARITEIIVPAMAVGYIALALFVIAMNITRMPEIFQTIFAHAFGFEAVFGGGLGAAISQGVRRGLFSNEAGLGSAPNAAAIAEVRHPVEQGFVQALSVFIDTLMICTCTAAIILLSDIDLALPSNDGVALTQNALASHVGSWAKSFVAVALFLFVFSSIMYNYFMGENALDFFSGENNRLFTVFRVVALGLIVMGSTLDLQTVFAFGDLTMGILALINLFALILLMPVARRLLKDFEAQRKQRARPVFDPSQFPDLDLDPRAWERAQESAARESAAQQG